MTRHFPPAAHVRLAREKGRVMDATGLCALMVEVGSAAWRPPFRQPQVACLQKAHPLPVAWVGPFPLGWSDTDSPATSLSWRKAHAYKTSGAGRGGLGV